MSSKTEVFSLPAVPADLCFNKNEFMKKNFSVDDFLLTHRNHASLETMRDDLGIYLKILRSAMIELINEDYGDFVNLSSNLVGLDKYIANIKKPLADLKIDIENFIEILNNNINDINICLNKKKDIMEARKTLKSLMKVKIFTQKLNSLLKNNINDNVISPPILERAALALVQLKFHKNMCRSLINANDLNEIDKLQLNVLDFTRKYFLKVLNDTTELERCLRIYSILDEEKIAEKVFKEDIVGVYMCDKISEISLKNSSQGLAGIYNQILDFISLKMKDLLLLTYYTEKVKGFDFIVNSFWNDVEERIENHMSSIFAPGNPDTFFMKYKCTLDFLNKIETILASEEAILNFNKLQQTKNFKSRWNLPVYFQIRFQEIASCLENSCSSKLTDKCFRNEKDFKSIQFSVAFTCLLKCWSNGVFIQDLFMKFFKLTLQCISRITNWLSITIKELKTNKEISLNKTTTLIALHSDCTKFIQKFDNVSISIKEKMPTIIKNSSKLVNECFVESENELSENLTKIENILSRILTEKCSISGRQVSDIPRLYRKTNRDVPTKNCTYVEHMFEPIKLFTKEYESELSNEIMKKITIEVCSNLTEQYYASVADVLISVKKTEESLRRLKNLRDKSQNQSAQAQNDRQVISDDDKIRIQLYVDVTYWKDQIENLKIPKESIQKLNELISLVEDTTKGKL